MLVQRVRGRSRNLSSAGQAPAAVVQDLAALKALVARPGAVLVETGQAKGVWQWEAGSSTTANDGTVVECTTGDAGRYKRIFDGAPYVEWFGATGDGVTDDSAAFVAALLVSTVINCTPFRTYLIKDVTVSGRTVQLNNGVIQPFTGAQYCLRLTGFGPKVIGGTINDPNGIVAKVTTLSAGASAGATSISVTSATGYEIGQWIAIMQDNGFPHGTIITNVSGTTITLERGIFGDCASGNEVCASWGMVNVNNCSRYLFSDLKFINTSIGIWNDRGTTAGATNTKGTLDNITVQDVTYLGIGVGRDVGEEMRTNVRVRGGRVRSQNATGDGVTTDFDTDRPVFLKSDVNVTVAGVATPVSSWVDSNTFRLGSAPANGAAVAWTNNYDAWFCNFWDTNGWATIRGAGDWVNCDALDGFYGSYFAEVELMKFDVCTDDTCQKGLYIYGCEQFLYGLYFNGFCSRTIEVDGNSTAITFGGPLYTDVVATASTVSGSVLGNFTVGSGSTILINTANWSTDSDKGMAGAGTYSTPNYLSSVAATGALTVTNNTDNASVTVATLEGDRATPADFDAAGVALRLSDDGGTQREVARLGWFADDVNVATGIDGGILFSVMVASVLTSKLRVDGTRLQPTSNDGLSIGAPASSFSDAFFAAGGVINWNNGNYTITHSTDLLTFSKGISRGAPVTKTADFTLAATETNVLNNKSGSACVATLPAASSFTGREVFLQNYQAQQLNSASSNVVPLGGGAAGTAILSANAGRWAKLVSDGTNWIITEGVI